MSENQAAVTEVEFTNSAKIQQVAKFIITTDRSIYRQQARQHRKRINRGRVVKTENDYDIFSWDDPDSARVAKLAALKAGIEVGEAFFFIQIA